MTIPHEKYYFLVDFFNMYTLYIALHLAWISSNMLFFKNELLPIFVVFSQCTMIVIWKQCVCLTRVILTVNTILVSYQYQINLHFLRKYNLYISRAITHRCCFFRNVQKCVFQPWHILSLQKNVSCSGWYTCYLVISCLLHDDVMVCHPWCDSSCVYVHFVFITFTYCLLYFFIGCLNTFCHHYWRWRGLTQTWHCHHMFQSCHSGFRQQSKK